MSLLTEPASGGGVGRTLARTIGALAVVLLLGGLALGGVGVERLSVLFGGGNPLASPRAAARVDFPYPVSPLHVWLEIEAARPETTVDAASVIALGDELSDAVGFWMLAATGASDVETAEQKLWADGGNPDALAIQFALQLQDRKVHIRDAHRLSKGLVEEGFRYADRDEILPLFLHVAHRLDLNVRIVRSPMHHYALFVSPDGTRTRGIEPTAFWRVNKLGKLQHTEERSVGHRLSFPENHFSSGAGGIRHGVHPPGPTAYTVVLAEELDEAWRIQLDRTQRDRTPTADTP